TRSGSTRNRPLEPQIIRPRYDSTAQRQATGIDVTSPSPRAGPRCRGGTDLCTHMLPSARSLGVAGCAHRNLFAAVAVPNGCAQTPGRATTQSQREDLPRRLVRAAEPCSSWTLSAPASAFVARRAPQLVWHRSSAAWGH